MSNPNIDQEASNNSEKLDRTTGNDSFEGGFEFVETSNAKKETENNNELADITLSNNPDYSSKASNPSNNEAKDKKEIETLKSIPKPDKLTAPANSTLKESIINSILRDLRSIWDKIKLVLDIRNTNAQLAKQILHWDLWGPLFFTLLLAAFTSINHRENQFLFIIIVFWFGSFIIYLNGRMLDDKASYFSYCCLLGYCIVPFVICNILLLPFNMFLIKLFLATIAEVWAMIIVKKFITIKIADDKMFLMLYPIGLFYTFFWYDIAS